MFYIELDEACVASRAPYTFDFEYLRPLIRLFFDEGMQPVSYTHLIAVGLPVHSRKRVALPAGMKNLHCKW